MQLTFKKNYKKGVTLIEVLVASIILSFVLSGVVMVLRLNTRLSNEGIAEAFLQTNLRLVTKQIAADVRNGCTLTLPDTNTIKITNKAGQNITWVRNATTKTLSRNGTVFNAIGVDTAKFTCKFKLDSDKNATIKIKLDVVKGTSFKATTGDSLILYRFNCRNVIKA